MKRSHLAQRGMACCGSRIRLAVIQSEPRDRFVHVSTHVGRRASPRTHHLEHARHPKNQSTRLSHHCHSRAR
jgi:hypothetical protein